MAEPLKNMYDEAFLSAFGTRVARAWAPFDAERFVRLALADGWEALALKGRIRRISLSLGAVLPGDYERALDILEEIAGECRGFPYLFFPDFVESYGLSHWGRSVRALALFTRSSSAEFAVRPFIKQDPARMMAQMLAWSADPDEHVRRLASEGCRPRLPWADALPAFKRDPSPILPILDALKADPSEYVRRSVANNLNDISKDHPALVMELATRWHGANPQTDALLRHACRGLIRGRADEDAMRLFGLLPAPEAVVSAWTVTPGTAAIGDAVLVAYEVQLPLPAGEARKLRLEMAVTYPRSAEGSGYRKLFRLAERVLEGGGTIAGTRKLSFKDLSTRRHYPGTHTLALVVNGKETATTGVVLEAVKEEAD
ncbi:DNA alkylation repair protein [Cohnella sp. JJ-181]|uniref:DNA alkylation repair protein n=1 Tax=Cohnella rhizoplanae TaxID=2974897 RepID=UPI0022FF824F|nr:DNA alkylation repair protein [Cohnella sp. JJ-181]CAI6068605.1 putative protein YhaZ [Cohnella sp. JJ-181]